MTLRELLEVVAKALHHSRVPYMVVGSLASAFHGEPRATQDIDIVIDPTPEQLADLLRSFEPETFYVGDGQAALATRGMFNVVDVTSGWKIDFIFRKDRAFSAAELSRRIEAELMGVHIFVATAEDTVVAKLEWAATGGSQRQFADAAAVIAVGGDVLDWDHLWKWAGALGLTEHLRRAASAAWPVAADMTDDEAMGLALAEAAMAGASGDVPVGAVVLGAGGELLARGHNQRQATNDPTAHAEVLALRDAASAAKSWRLGGTTVVVTLEPCPMCAGALVAARVARLVFGAADPKAGACGSLYNLCADPRLNHELAVTPGVRAGECATLLSDFFVARRGAR